MNITFLKKMIPGSACRCIWIVQDYLNVYRCTYCLNVSPLFQSQGEKKILCLEIWSKVPKILQLTSVLES